MIKQSLALFRFLRPYCLKNKRYFYILSLFLVAGVALELPMPLFLKYFIDHIIAEAKPGSLGTFAVLLVGLLAAKFAIDNGKQHFMFAFKEKTFIELQQAVIDETIKIKYEFFEKNNTGYVISRIHNELLNLQSFFWDFFIKIVTDALVFIFGLYFLLKFSLKLTVISLLLLPFYIYVMRAFSSRIKRQSEAFQEGYSQVFGFLYEIIQMIFLIKTLLLNEYASGVIRGKLQDFYKIKLRQNKVNVLFMTVVALIGGLSPVFVLYFGGWEIINHRISLGTLIAFNSFLGYIFGPTKNYLSYGSNLASALASFQRIQAILGMKRDEERGEAIDEIRSVAFRDVSFGYEGTLTVKNLTFRIDRGERLGLFGAIGSGKTTIIKLLLGLYDGYLGVIEYNGRDIRTISKLTKKVGIIPQDNILFSDTVYNNISLGNRHGDERGLERIAAELRIHEMLKGKEKGMDYELKHGGTGLSGGEKQKIAAARLLYRNPDLVILDEGTAHLDIENELLIMGRLVRFTHDKILIIISHRLTNMVGCDRIIYLRDGEIVDIAGHEELCRKYPEYLDAYLKQSEERRRESWNQNGN